MYNVYGSHSNSYKSHANLFLQICIHAWLIPSTLCPILKNSMYFIAKMPQSPDFDCLVVVWSRTMVSPSLTITPARTAINGTITASGSNCYSSWPCIDMKDRVVHIYRGVSKNNLHGNGMMIQGRWNIYMCTSIPCLSPEPRQYPYDPFNHIFR